MRDLIQKILFREKILSTSLRFVSWLLQKVFGISPKAAMYFFKARKLGNPTNTMIPEETLPMVTRMLGTGIWNYSFFQFHREFYFPFWAERQYDPKDPAFIPRSHNVLSINQTHRNWVAISWPGMVDEISIDPAGAIMLGADNPTVEFCLLAKKKLYRPQNHPKNIKIKKISPWQAEISFAGYILLVEATLEGAKLSVHQKKNSHHKHSSVLFSLRPFNMEGPSFIHHIKLTKNNEVKSRYSLSFSTTPKKIVLSSYKQGDALSQILHKNNSTKEIWDSTGMATAAFLFSKTPFTIQVQNSRRKKLAKPLEKYHHPEEIINTYFPKMPSLSTLEQTNRLSYLAEAYQDAKNHLITLWDFDSITPGSYTYHEFWIRDAAIMLHALLSLNGHKAVKSILPRLKHFIQPSGFFKSQAGEWDANGQALWVLAKYFQYHPEEKFWQQWKKDIKKLIHWIDVVTKEHNGILPPGFSAEHLGVADWYLWDNFWALAGITEWIYTNDNFHLHSFDPIKEKMQTIQLRMETALLKYLEPYSFYPAAIGRHIDAGMIGSVAATYPTDLNIFATDKPRLRKTLDILHNRFFYRGGFFQENIHSGINAYLTIQVAQGYLRLGERKKALKIFFNILKKASHAHTFPEAIHPVTGGGCMGDGFHGWAFAEITLFIRDLFVRESNNQLLFFTGIRKRWFEENFTFENLRIQNYQCNITSNNGSWKIQHVTKKETKSAIVFLPENKKIYIGAKELQPMDQCMHVVKGRIPYEAPLHTDWVIQ
ncbi:MAG: hypothetical protein D6767_06845 [Candidatus Hydrogenedentota bacterium]|nr:MAG: hypothetical protein D6767_06845 [Candidatus Hydrogenedentota bacterium]